MRTSWKQFYCMWCHLPKYNRIRCDFDYVHGSTCSPVFQTVGISIKTGDPKSWPQAGSFSTCFYLVDVIWNSEFKKAVSDWKAGYCVWLELSTSSLLVLLICLVWKPHSNKDRRSVARLDNKLYLSFALHALLSADVSVAQMDKVW